MDVLTKDTNLAQCTGRILKKHYNEDEKRLFLTMSLFTPKWAASKDPKSSMNRDYPTFVAEGEDAEKYNNEFQEGEFVSIFGRVTTRSFYGPSGQKKLYKKMYEPTIVIDTMLKDYGHENINSIVLAGTVVFVQEIRNSGVGFYMISMETVNEDGSVDRPSLVFFDMDMRTNVEVGDAIVVNAALHTKTIEKNKATSIVARSLSFISKAE